MSNKRRVNKKARKQRNAQNLSSASSSVTSAAKPGVKPSRVLVVNVPYHNRRTKRFSFGDGFFAMFDALGPRKTQRRSLSEAEAPMALASDALMIEQDMKKSVRKVLAKYVRIPTSSSRK